MSGDYILAIAGGGGGAGASNGICCTHGGAGGGQSGLQGSTPGINSSVRIFCSSFTFHRKG